MILYRQRHCSHSDKLRQEPKVGNIEAESRWGLLVIRLKERGKGGTPFKDSWPQCCKLRDTNTIFKSIQLLLIWKRPWPNMEFICQKWERECPYLDTIVRKKSRFFPLDKLMQLRVFFLPCLHYFGKKIRWGLWDHLCCLCVCVSLPA
jgi:hypothetical protein